MLTAILDPLDGINLSQDKDTLIERFSHPNIKDSLSRICLESSAKLPTFLIVTIIENLVNSETKEQEINIATLVNAAWCLYSDKRIDQNRNGVVQGELAEELIEFIENQGANTKLNIN